MVDCQNYFIGSGVCLPGCSSVPGVCSGSGLLCDADNTCADDSDCLGIDCLGSVSCAGFASDACDDLSGYGCSPSSCSAASARSMLTGYTGSEQVCDEITGCSFTCDGPVYEEICSNRVDDTGNLLVDCQDSACRVVSLSDADARGRYNCLGTNQTGDKDYYVAGDYYCGVGVELDVFSGELIPVPDVGLCCEVGKYPRRDILGVWSCIDSEPCLSSVSPFGTCDFTYGLPAFSDWLASPGCVDVSVPKACCQVVAFGSEEYYSMSGNVVIY